MTHARPIPDAALPPYPAHPAPIEHPKEPEAEIVETVRALPLPKSKSDPRWSRAGIGVGIGSAAIVAALLYSNWSKSGPKRK